MIKKDGKLTGPRDHRKIAIWKDVPAAEWDDWKWQLRNRITTVDVLRQVVDMTEKEQKEVTSALRSLRMAITPYYASLMDPNDRNCPVRKRAIPSGKEVLYSPEDMLDPLHEDIESPAPGLTHRYPDRVLLQVTDQCSMYCRHCTRRRTAGETDRPLPKSSVLSAIEYIKDTPQVRDVLLSGGDPLTLGDDYLEDILRRVRAIPHVEILRIGSAAPVVMPQRVTPALVAMLRKYHPLYLNVHFNHPKEVTPESKKACEMLADGGIPLGNQTVLMKGINDSPIVMKKLVHDIIRIRVRPYYVYQCDLSQGIGHFRTSVSKGIELIENLRGHTSGFAVPMFVVDGPGGGGKIPVMPNYVVSRNDRRIVLRNYEGVLCTYTEPEPSDVKCPDEDALRKEFPLLENREGVTTLLRGERVSLTPPGLERKSRARLYKKGKGRA